MNVTMPKRTGRLAAVADRSNRSGLILVVVLIGLMVVAMFSATLIRAVLTQRRQLDGQLHQIQAMWLALSGLERAAEKLRNDEGYSGELWQVPAEQLAGLKGGAVQIRVRNQQDQRSIEVEAVYPSGSTDASKYQLTVPVDSQGEAEGSEDSPCG